LPVRHKGIDGCAITVVQFIGIERDVAVSDS
jgi:hypothetical protein